MQCVHLHRATLVVDPGDASPVTAWLKANQLQLDGILVTHHHGDHSGGNIAFKGIVEHVIAHENSLKNQKA